MYRISIFYISGSVILWIKKGFETLRTGHLNFKTYFKALENHIYIYIFKFNCSNPLMAKKIFFLRILEIYSGNQLKNNEN